MIQITIVLLIIVHFSFQKEVDTINVKVTYVKSIPKMYISVFFSTVVLDTKHLLMQIYIPNRVILYKFINIILINIMERVQIWIEEKFKKMFVFIFIDTFFSGIATG